jgi:choline-sulfatase
MLPPRLHAMPSQRSRRQVRSQPVAPPPPPRPRRALLLAFLAATVVLVLAGLFVVARRPAAPASGSAVRLNVLLVTLDTTRADRLGSYGYARARTPFLDSLAAAGTRFDRAYSSVPITAPAHASILTGLYPFEHGVRNNGDFYLADRFETLATILKKSGYDTAAFVSAFVLDRRYGLARGFDLYDDRQDGDDKTAQVINLEAERRGDRTAAALSAWLDRYAQDRSAPFFAWLHLYDPHTPYSAPAPYGPDFADSPYDGEVAFVDSILAGVMDKLARAGLRDDTVVVVVGDHGESLGEHGEETHGMFVYDGAIRVPFIVWRPGVVPVATVREPVRITDVLPTVLEILRIPAAPLKNGRSLVGAMGGRPAAPPPVYAETLFPELNMNWAPIRSVRDERWKLIEAPRPELYDTQNDPAERDNRHGQQAQTARALADVLTRVSGGGPGEMSRQAMDRATVDRLASLGYIGAGGGAGAGASSSKPDPKDVILAYNRLNTANRLVEAGRLDEALPILRGVLAQDPRNAFAHQLLGNVHLQRGENAMAIREYQALLANVPANAQAHHWIALCHLRLGQPAKALLETEAALAIDPKYPDARILRGSILAGRGAYDAAILEFRAALETDPAKPRIRLDLAKVLLDAGRPGDARGEYEAILRQQADYAPALAGLGALHAAEGRYDEAAALLARAIAITPSDWDSRINLAKVYERQARIGDAAAEYQRLRDDAAAPADLRAAAALRVRELQARAKDPST